jgi:disulfide bond formation protein DsbB
MNRPTPTPTPTPTPRRLWLLLAAGCLGLVGASLALTAWLNLHPCHLCVFQRLLFMGLAALGLVVALVGCRGAGRIAGGLFALLATGGVAVAGYQSWLQAHPVGTIGCGVGRPGLIEGLVEQLGAWLPSLFLATGLCDDPQLIILGLSLANWAGLAFAICLAAAGWAWARCWRSRRKAQC